MSSEMSEELPRRSVSQDVVLLARVLEAESWPLPLMGLIDLTQISQTDELFADNQNQNKKETK